MQIPSPVAVVGAGFVGRPLVERLAAEGAEVRATTRNGSWDGERPPGVETRPLDLVNDDAETIRFALAGMRSIVLCYSSGGTQDKRRLYLDGGPATLEVEPAPTAATGEGICTAEV